MGFRPFRNIGKGKCHFSCGSYSVPLILDFFLFLFSLAATAPSNSLNNILFSRFRDDVYRLCCDTSPNHTTWLLLFLNSLRSCLGCLQDPTVMGFIMGKHSTTLQSSKTISTHHSPLPSFHFIQTNKQHRYHIPSPSTARTILSCHPARFLSLPLPQPSLNTISSLPPHRSICQTHRPLPSYSRHLRSPRHPRHLRLPRPQPPPRLAQCRKPLRQTQCQTHR